MLCVTIILYEEESLYLHVRVIHDIYNKDKETAVKYLTDESCDYIVATLKPWLLYPGLSLRLFLIKHKARGVGGEARPWLSNNSCHSQAALWHRT